MTVALIVVALGILGVAIVAFAVRKKPSETRTGPREGDTAWNDPIEGVEPTVPETRTDGFDGAQRAPTDTRP
jgi:hypothetical protein